ncbi:hypothetical protein C0J52_03220 [Blattella germanica]|nr:hypothetical protein C0J52_03220 [Blattella germanica]
MVLLFERKLGAFGMLRAKILESLRTKDFCNHPPISDLDNYCTLGGPLIYVWNSVELKNYLLKLNRKNPHRVVDHATKEQLYREFVKLIRPVTGPGCMVQVDTSVVTRWKCNRVSVVKKWVLGIYDTSIHCGFVLSSADRP